MMVMDRHLSVLAEVREQWKDIPEETRKRLEDLLAVNTALEVVPGLLTVLLDSSDHLWVEVEGQRTNLSREEVDLLLLWLHEVRARMVG